VAARYEQGGHAGENGGHAAGGAETVFHAFQQTHLLHELVDVRVGKPRIDVVVDLVGEQRAGVLGVVEHETRREVDGRGMLPESPFMLTADGLGLKLVIAQSRFFWMSKNSPIAGDNTSG